MHKINLEEKGVNFGLWFQKERKIHGREVMVTGQESIVAGAGS